MSKRIAKNKLARERVGLGLSLRQVAEILDKPTSRVWDLEHGLGMPTVLECVACEMLYKQSFADLWPHVHGEMQLEIDGRIRRFVAKLQAGRVRSARQRNRLNTVCQTLKACQMDYEH